MGGTTSIATITDEDCGSKELYITYSNVTSLSVQCGPLDSSHKKLYSSCSKILGNGSSTGGYFYFDSLKYCGGACYSYGVGCVYEGQLICSYKE